MTDRIEHELRQLLAEDTRSRPDVAALHQWGRRRSFVRRAVPVAAAAAVVAVAVGIGVSTQRGEAPTIRSPHSVTSTAPDTSSSHRSTSAPTTDSASDEKAAASATMRQWIASVPIYPGARSAIELHPTTPRVPQAIEGLFALSQSWVAPADFRTTVAWYRSRVAAAGFTGQGSIGDADQWQIGATAPAAYRQNTYAGTLTLTLTINDTGSSTSVSLEAAGAPVPARSAGDRVPLDEIVSGAITVTPAGSPVPDGYEPKRATTVSVNQADRTQLITAVNDAHIQPPVTASGVGFGYTITVTLRTGSGSSYVVRYSSYLPVNGPILELPDHRKIILEPGLPLVLQLKKLAGVSP